MNLRTLIISLSVLTASAFPLYPSANQRDVALADPRENEAQDKTEFSKDAHSVYKSYVDRGDLYAAEEGEAGRHGHPMEEEMRRKITAESERLRDRLRQGLAELTERLSPDPGAPLRDLRLRLAPLVQQLWGSLGDNVQEVCGQLSMYLRGLEWAESQAESTSAYREALDGIGQTLEQGGARLTDITADFQSKAWEAMDQKRELGGGGGAGPEEEEEVEEEAERSGGMWGEMRSTLAQELSSMRLEAQSRLGALEAELAAALGSSQPLNTEAAAGVNGFCQGAALQNQVSLARIERLLLGSEEEQEAPGGRGAPAAPAEPSQTGSLLQEDFSAKFSALIQDILHSVQ